jgi:hypothetical protein
LPIVDPLALVPQEDPPYSHASSLSACR